MEMGQDFYTKTQVTDLGFVVHLKHADGLVSVHCFSDLSYSLAHSAFFASCSIHDLIPRIK